MLFEPQKPPKHLDKVNPCMAKAFPGDSGPSCKTMLPAKPQKLLMDILMSDKTEVKAKPNLWRSHLATHGLKASHSQHPGAGNHRFTARSHTSCGVATCNVLLLRLKPSRCASATERFLAYNGYRGLITCGKWHPR